MVQLGSTMVLSDWADHSAYNEFCAGVAPAACNQSLDSESGALRKVSEGGANLWKLADGDITDSAGKLVSTTSGSTNPFGGNVTDLGYDAQSRLVSVRDSLGSYQVAAGTAAADTTSATVVAYDPTTARVASVTAPKAEAPAPTRLSHSYQYASVSETRVHVAGLSEPPSSPWARKVTFDLNGRLTADTAPSGLSATTAYDTLDQPLVITATTGMRTTTFYDPEGRPTDSYGPAAHLVAAVATLGSTFTHTSRTTRLLDNMVRVLTDGSRPTSGVTSRATFDTSTNASGRYELEGVHHSREPRCLCSNRSGDRAVCLSAE